MARLALAARRAGRAAPLLLVVALATAPVTLAGQGGTGRPFRGSLGGEVNFYADWSDPVCPVTTVTDAGGQPARARASGASPRRRWLRRSRPTRPR